MIYQAIHTALKAHEHQIRKLDQDLYAAHPIEVGMLLAKYGFDDEVVCAGILHDTLEDTELTFEHILDRFGPRVANLVNACSEQDKALDWKTRKVHYLANLKNVPLEVLYIVCADKLTNLSSIHRNLEHMGETLWHRFNAGAHQQQWYYREALKALEPIKEHELYGRLEKEITEVFDDLGDKRV